MRRTSTRGRLLVSTMICSAAMAAFAASPAAAQDEGATEVEEIVVTGSRIPQRNLETTSPITQVTAEDITTQGVTRVEDLVTQLPQAFAAQNSTVSNGASGTATVSLRNLGSSRTLVLIDGRRMPYGSPQDDAADLNQIPGQLVDRVEVLTGGASAVYGSDAIAGVVNFIMKKNFEGVQLDAQYGFYQHNNDYDGPGALRDAIAARAATNPSQFRLPDDNVIDGYSKEVTLMLGANSPDGKGNVTAYVGYRNNDAVLQANRDYSACSLGAIGSGGATNFSCGGSGTSFPGQFTDFSTFAFTVGGAGGNEFVPYSSSLNAYNFGPLNYFQRPDERYVLGAFGNYEINDKVELYTQLMFADYSSVAQIAPSGNFFSTSTINCGNPLLSAQQANAIGCDATEIANDTPTTLYIGRRNVEGGGRQSDLRFQSYRGVVGVRGDLNEAWGYDVAAQYSRVQLSSVYRNEFSTRRLNNALDVVSDPVTGDPVCRSVLNGTDPDCVPYDIFTLGNVSQEALDYVQVPLLLTGATTQQVVTAAVNGDLGAYGFQSPWANDSIKVAFGVEYRRDTLVLEPDVTYATGDGAGQGGPTLGLEGTSQVNDIFAEINAPLINDMPFAHLVSVNAAFRYSDYFSGISTDTYTVGADWAPTEDIRFRGSISRAVRAPNVIELFTAQGFNLFDMDEDPCGPAKTATLAQCTATGVPAANYGSAALDSPAGQYNFLQGGNPNLEPEEADTKTFGIVFTPTFLPGFNLSVDWYDIEIAKTITTFGAQNAIIGCYEQNDPASCAKINRNALGQLWIGDGFVEDLNTNIGGIKTSGVDVNASYRFDLDRVGLNDLGRATVSLTGTWLSELETTPNNVNPAYDCVGYYGSVCGIPNPEWRHRARLSWETPWNADLNVTWRYYGEVELKNGINNRPDFSFDSKNYIDLAGTWQVRENTNLRFGVNNVFDIDPPLSASVGTTGNGNTYPQTYDALGRYFFGGITIDF